MLREFLGKVVLQSEAPLGFEVFTPPEACVAWLTERADDAYILYVHCVNIFCVLLLDYYIPTSVSVQTITRYSYIRDSRYHTYSL